jgi:hypothetical protein
MFARISHPHLHLLSPCAAQFYTSKKVSIRVAFTPTPHAASAPDRRSHHRRPRARRWPAPTPATNCPSPGQHHRPRAGPPSHVARRRLHHCPGHPGLPPPVARPFGLAVHAVPAPDASNRPPTPAPGRHHHLQF